VIFDIKRKNYSSFLVLEVEVHLDAMGLYDTLKKRKKRRRKKVKIKHLNVFLWPNKTMSFNEKS